MRKLIIAVVCALAVGSAAISDTASAHGTYVGRYQYACSPYGCILRPVYASCIYLWDGRRGCWDFHTH